MSDAALNLSGVSGTLNRFPNENNGPGGAGSPPPPARSGPTVPAAFRGGVLDGTWAGRRDCEVFRNVLDKRTNGLYRLPLFNDCQSVKGLSG
jgi:hypothetical protein